MLTKMKESLILNLMLNILNNRIYISNNLFSNFRNFRSL